MTKIQINNGNWANWGVIWPDFKIKHAVGVWGKVIFQTKIAQHKAQ